MSHDSRPHVVQAAAWCVRSSCLPARHMELDRLLLQAAAADEILIPS